MTVCIRYQLEHVNINLYIIDISIYSYKCYSERKRERERESCILHPFPETVFQGTQAHIFGREYLDPVFHPPTLEQQQLQSKIC